jgi:2-iminobutanoate/2-iminopropanoate deaminase
MSKKVIISPTSPNPIGPYSHAIETNGMIFTSGQVAINPETGDMMQASITQETAQVMENLKKILTSAGVTFDHVIKSTIFLTNLDDFNEVNVTYGEYFSESYPARETVQVVRLPRGARVEISMIAAR